MTDTSFRPRFDQERILAYRGGRMGVSAVPGAGKTHVMAVLAAQLMASAISDDQEVLIVTLVNSAVENVKRRVADLTGRLGLLRNLGYRVRTLHGLAHDIVRERPELVGLADDFTIVDERESEQACEGAAEVWLRGHPDSADEFLSLDLSDSQREAIVQTQWPATVNSLATVFIRYAKDRGLTPEAVRDMLASASSRSGQPAAILRLAQVGAEIYADYQRSLNSRGSVDFDDLIRLALVALRQDGELLARIHHRWPFVLEDEAQDSSLLQEQILRLIAGPNGDWVRVGDPNQSINTTFTTANPRFLRAFLDEPGVTAMPMVHSGRSQPSIIDLANHLIEWTMSSHPEERVRTALGPPFIWPTPPGDPQPNPPANPAALFLWDQKLSPDAEIAAVAQSLARWLPEHPGETVAVLVPRNKRGFEVADKLKRTGIPFAELLRSTSSTRRTAGVLGNVLHYLANPASVSLLARLFEVWRRDDQEDNAQSSRLKGISLLVRKCRNVEDFLWPRPGHDWLAQIDWSIDAEASDATTGRPDRATQHPYVPVEQDRILLEAFRELVCRWQGATVLPVDQLLLTVAQDLFIDPGELALSHKLAVMLRLRSDDNPEWRLPELTAELAQIARNQRRFLGFAEQDTGFEAEPGVVTISTLHRAKGLEWDRVYLLSVNNYDFPSAQPYDEYISEPWFIRDRLNLEAEALEQLDCLVSGRPYSEGEATQRARLDYVAERLRLLYVGITRARRELVLTWNTGRSREAKLMAVPFIALHTWWQQRQEGSASQTQG
jgi:DNA helicase-2/ATP-dependent DNA helicase PcrA